VGRSTIREYAWRLSKAKDIVKLLALAPDHRLHRERALELLWPSLGRKAATNNLRQALRVARRMFDPDPEDRDPNARLPTTATATISGDKPVRRR